MIMDPDIQIGYGHIIMPEAIIDRVVPTRFKTPLRIAILITIHIDRRPIVSPYESVLVVTALIRAGPG